MKCTARDDKNNNKNKLYTFGSIAFKLPSVTVDVPVENNDKDTKQRSDGICNIAKIFRKL